MRVVLRLALERPKAHHVANDRTRDLKDWAPTWPPGARSGDCDNYAKAVLDALQSWPSADQPALAYADDGQVVSLEVHKRYTGLGEPERPGCWITLEEAC